MQGFFRSGHELLLTEQRQPLQAHVARDVLSRRFGPT